MSIPAGHPKIAFFKRVLPNSTSVVLSIVFLSSVLRISCVSMRTCRPVSSCVRIKPISRSSSPALFFKKTSLVLRLKRSGMICTSMSDVAHETTAVKIFATVSTTATTHVCALKVHRLIKWVPPHSMRNTPNCTNTHL